MHDTVSPNTEQTGPRPLKAIIADLSKTINAKRLKDKVQGGTKITFVPWYEVVRILDFYAPGWSYEIPKIETAQATLTDKIVNKVTGETAYKERPATMLVMTARISIPCAEGVVYREASGLEEVKNGGYGDAATNAESAALRRAAAKFGVALYLYDK